MPPLIGAPPHKRSGPAGRPGAQHLRIVWDKEQAEPTPALPGAQLTEQDRRSLRGLADWPFPLTLSQLVWLRHIAGAA